MTIGQKIQLLKESMNFKNYQEMGLAIGFTGKEPGNWLLDMSKKDTIQTVDITRLIRVADYFNVTLDWLLKDNEEWVIDVEAGYEADDIGTMLDNIKNKLSDGNNKYYGSKMNGSVVALAKDTIDEVKILIKENL